MEFKPELSVNQSVVINSKHRVELVVKREDLIHPIVSGNKYHKLKFNLEEAIKRNFNTILTFGGAYSNHIAAVAKAGRIYGLKTIGIIRGEELRDHVATNPTLQFAHQSGMQFEFVSREMYRKKNTEEFITTINSKFGEVYILPEGGTNTLAVEGCEGILTDEDKDFDYVCCPVGTGGTISGVINCSKPSQQVLGFPALKGSFLKEDISKFANKENWKLILDYHFGGYAKINTSLISFINQFKKEQNIPLDPVYTGKMMYGIFDLIEKGYFSQNAKILAIHTGGLQGIDGMNLKLKAKGWPLLD
ncbi:1-aminocyclopropane-1-carboxylate deaminase/D-cysteine desulfhydrase [Geojedonia litorea]|uniref:1-aminocyclopropane-1-carboxylate deaminase/D-cysteine desulfhydrase n=1 Tax=Geojedonia litorea TaxID=1268269 RepID=A0ABV9N4D0_9FLAO